MTRKERIMLMTLLMIVFCSGCLSYSHYKYSKRAEAARVLPEGMVARPGRIYYASFPENCLAVSVLGWHPCVGHAALVTSDKAGLVKQYDYGWFVGRDGGELPDNAIGYVGKSPRYGMVRRKTFPVGLSAKATNDIEVAKMVLDGMAGYGNKVELWAKDVDDIGVAERYMEQFAADEDRGSMAWRCWQIGGYRCGNVTRQAFDAARGEGHFLDLLWGGFPGADAPSVGTSKTTYSSDDVSQKRIMPCKEIVDDMRALWSYERNYSYRHKSLAASISEMGDGTGIGKNGFILKPALWAARIDADNAQPEPLSYKVKNPSTGQSESAKYFFGVFPVKADTGERDRFSVVIVAVPEKPAEDDVCFIAICGPVNLQNDFSFDKEWPVFQLKAESVVVESIHNLKSSTHTELIQRLKNGDLKNFVTRSFDNLYYPSESKDSDSSSTHKQTKE